ncbi:peptidoglycan editing factor PgeF [Calidifontibacter indicus]|uniref:Purine nucleoside phosphorylase n=1 Tax=Calidifontibacter indicus TaxID=419650 RepID=A0A3D9USL6_9MICO|nr:peptidoglycan editing factor PgeF [Calidifontibacter indicus]REF31503.1 hypothetical protein DFJ65_2572 [Calidifontibacter indicus]
MFWWRDEREVGDWVVDLAFTDSEGGVSRGGYAGLNLGAHVGDDPEAVATNRERLAQAVDTTDLRFMAQVHGADVAVLEQQSDGAPAPTADGQVTSAFDRTLVVLVADCTPVLIYDREQPLVAAVHAGRPGMLAAVVPETVRTMRELGSGRLGAVVGPSVCSRCYEVPAQMRDDAAARVPASYAVSWTGTPAIDVAAGVVSQLRADDVELDWIPGCTREEGRLYSHRRDPGAGRFAGVVTLRRRA